MKKYIVIAALIASGCSSMSPTNPSEVKGTAEGNITSNASNDNTQPKWPVLIPGDGYGKEDERYPPSSEQCPVGYSPVYNGHNWVCENGKNREFPR